MTIEEKIQYIMRIFERESKKYMLAPMTYDRKEEIWLHEFLTKSNFENSLRNNDETLEIVYQVALNLSARS